MGIKKYLLLILIVSSCQSGKEHHNKEYVIQITSKYVDFSIETIIDIDCDKFETQFNNRIKAKVIKDSNRINEILGFLRNLKPAGKNYYQHIDTRMKLELKYNPDSIETICIDNFKIQRNGKLYINSDSLMSILKDK